jgi:hypothetical protein
VGMAWDLGVVRWLVATPPCQGWPRAGDAVGGQGVGARAWGRSGGRAGLDMNRGGVGGG